MSSATEASNANDSRDEYEFYDSVGRFLIWEHNDGHTVIQNEQSNEMALFHANWSKDGQENTPLLMHRNYVKNDNVSDTVEEMFNRRKGCSPMDIRPDMDIRPEQDDSDDEDDSKPEDDRDEYQKVVFNGVIDTDVLDIYLRHTEELYDEFIVVINKYGWHLRVVNPSNTVMMDARIHTDDWEQYDSVRDGPIGVSHDSLQDMTAFVEATDGHAHISVEDGRLTFSDGDRLFTDTRLIDPDSMRRRPEKYDLGELRGSQCETTTGLSSSSGKDDNRARATFDGDAMWNMTKFVRANKKVKETHLSIGGNGVGFDFDTNYKGVQTREPYMETEVETDGAADGWHGMEFLYDILKQPLKAQLTEVPYTFVIHDTPNDKLSGGPLTVSRNFGTDSKLMFTVAPRVKH